MPQNLTQRAIEQYADALRAEQYRVRLVNSLTDQAKPVAYSATQLTDPKTVAFLRWQNSLGFDVYARPVGWQYVLLDDLDRPALARLQRDDLRPCLLIETSPDNYQAWLTLAQCPADREQAKAMCRHLAQTYGADLCSAEPDHVGRLPGLTNRKPRHQQAGGHFPFVQLRRAQHRPANISTPAGGCVPTDTGPDSPVSAQYTPNIPAHGAARTSGQLLDRQGGTSGRAGTSEHDFGIVMGLLDKGRSDEQIRAHLLAHSPDLLARKGRYADTYITRTIGAARRRAGRS